MAVIWHKNNDGWSLLSPSSFPNEKTLHDLIEEAPHVLPLSGQPQLTIVGREVNLGGNFADLIAIDESGQIVIVEVKLRDNAESRRAVIAQILTYAAFLHGMRTSELQTLLTPYITKHSYSDLVDAVERNLQSGDISRESFQVGIDESLRDGQFRLVIVLDRAPNELIRLVGYLDSVAAGLTLDLIVVSSFDINGQQVIVPQRVEPDKQIIEQISGKTMGSTIPAKTTYEQGSQPFEQRIVNAKEEHRIPLYQILGWARELEINHLAILRTAIGSTRSILTPQLPNQQRGMVSFYNMPNGIGIDVFSKVVSQLAPNSISRIESAIAESNPTSAWYARSVTDELLNALSQAYREANSNYSI